MKYYLEAFKKYGTFSGRTSRKGFWMFYLFNLIFTIVASIIDAILGTITIITAIYALVMWIPSLSILVRRLHDIDKSGWWYFIAAIPVIGTIWFLVLVCTEGTRGINQYGDIPAE